MQYRDNGYDVRTILLCIAALSAALSAQDFTGTWQGTLRNATGKNVRLTTKIARIGDKLTATLYTIDQPSQPVPATSLTLSSRSK